MIPRTKILGSVGGMVIMSVSGTSNAVNVDMARVQFCGYLAESFTSAYALAKIVPELNAIQLTKSNEAALHDMTSNGTRTPTNGLRVSSASEPHHGVSASAIPKGTGSQIG